jgi:hypothetical protein
MMPQETHRVQNAVRRNPAYASRLSSLKLLIFRSRGPLAVIAAVICFFWKAVFTKQYTLWDSDDLAKQVLPWFAFAGNELHRGHLPLWDPHAWGGQSLIGQAQPGLCYPLNWLLFLVAFPAKSLHRLIYMLDLYVVLIHVLGALAFYVLARSLQRSRTASAISAVAFTACGYMATVGWPQRLNGAILTPLVFLFFVRVWQGRDVVRNSALCGACLGVALLSGHHEAPIFIALAVGGAWLYRLWEQRNASGWRKQWIGAAAFLLFTVLVGAVQILPAAEYGRLAFRWVNANQPVTFGKAVPYDVHAKLSFNPRSLLGVFVPWLNDGFSPFLGWTIAVIAASGVISWWRVKEVKLFFAVALGGLLFSFGGLSIFHGVIYALVPEVEKARSVEFATLLFGFGACVLFAFGIDGIAAFRSEHFSWARRFNWLLAGSAGVLTLATFFAFETGSAKIDTNYVLFSGLCATLLLGALNTLWANQIRLRTAHVLLAGLTVFELGAILPQGYRHIEQGWPDLEPLGKYQDVADFLRHQPNFPRLDIDDDAIPFNFGDWYGIDVFREYLASITRNVFELYADDVYWSRMLFATEYTASKKPPANNQVPAFESRDGVHIYRNTDALPRAWLAHSAVSVRREEAARRLQSADHLKDVPYVVGTAPALETCASPDNTSVVSVAPDEVVVDADTSCRALLIDADAYYPGWSVSVDNNSAHLIEVFGALRGVTLPAGHHRVVFRYRPLSVLLGACLSLVGTVAALMIWRQTRRQPADGIPEYSL